jgi:hypothetical protein
VQVYTTEVVKELADEAHTARKQNKNVLALLTACCRARAGTGSLPSLFERDVVVAA